MLYITGRHEASSTVLQGSLNLVDLAGRWVGGGLGVGCRVGQWGSQADQQAPLPWQPL